MLIVREKALELISGPYATDNLQAVRALKAFVRNSVTLVGEPEELLTSPARMITDIDQKGRAYGDCDDVATLGAALLASIGFPVRFKAILPREDGTYQHVFLEFQYPIERPPVWRALDLTTDTPPVYPDNYLIQEV